MKLNWGHYIVIAFSGFVLLILFMVYKSFQLDNDLVAEDYYAKELKFQEVIDKKQRASELDQDITWQSSEMKVVLSFPELPESIAGNIVLFRPSDKEKDLELAIAPNDNSQQIIADESLTSGKYIIQIDWTSGDNSYYTEGTVFVKK